MYQADKIKKSLTEVDKEISDLDGEIDTLCKKIKELEKKRAEVMTLRPGLMKALALLSTNLPNKKEPDVVIRHRDSNLLYSYK